MKKYLLATLLSASTFTLAVSPAFAVETRMTIKSETNAENVQEVRMNSETKSNVKVNGKMMEATGDKCAKAEEQTKKIIGKYREAYPQHVANYRRTAQRLSEVSVKLKAEGKDTAKLDAEIKIFNDKITKLDTEVKAIMTQLEAAQKFTCGESQGQYAAEMKKARALTQTALKTHLEVRTYYQASVRPAVQALRSAR